MDFCSGTPKYLLLYRHIRNQIESERLQADEKLPSVRSLASYLKVNASTVVHAYSLLERDRYICKKDRSGSFVCSKKEIEISSSGDLRFDLANPKAGMFDTLNFKKAVEAAIANEGESLFDYQEGLGYGPLRECICQYIEAQGIFSEPDRIQIISGAQQGINIITKSLFSYGDVVFTEAPSYPGAIEVFRENGLKIVGIPLLSDGPDMGILKRKLEKIRPVLFYLMPNFQNPTGITYSKKKKIQLLELAEKYDFWIMEDDYISDFPFESEDNFTIRAYDKNQRTVYIKSFSKILMPGLRIAFVEMPGHIRSIVSRTKSSMDISTSSFIQLSLFYYMKHFNWKEHLKSVGALYERRFAKAKRILSKTLGEDLRFREAAGGINFFAELPRHCSSLDLKRYLEDRNIRIQEGAAFYPNVKAENDFRISIAHIEEEKLRSSLDHLAENILGFLREKNNKTEVKKTGGRQ
ncbi:MAG: PLP-dependent aminotransferase family protein [Peptostreptococcaceae bacterium]|nr:PLP-dependent aminotransferase family protein [Peptostreptococcaceae bacterium]